jgi:hypothetical protein
VPLPQVATNGDAAITRLCGQCGYRTAREMDECEAQGKRKENNGGNQEPTNVHNGVPPEAQNRITRLLSIFWD